MTSPLPAPAATATADLAGRLAAGGILRMPEAPVKVRGRDPVLASRHAIGEAAATALALGGAAAAELLALRGGRLASVEVDVGAAAATLLGFLFQSAPAGARALELARAQPPATRLAACRDGRFIHLHGGFPHLSDGTLRLLGCAADGEAIDAAAARWDAFALEEALAQRRLCGAVVRSPEEWAQHPQGAALAAEPVVRLTRIGDAPPEPLPPAPDPLAGVRVLDATRVLAGPACGRTLAQYGADVLRVSSPALPSIPAFVLETGHGKRSAFVDLARPGGAETLRGLAREADVFCDGYRPGALARRGFGAAALAALRPGIVAVSVCCYGQWGPWAERAGWEQLAQSATGMAWTEGGAEAPRLAPAAATDYTTGYLAAWGALEALRRRAQEGGSWRVEVSLCRTAMWIQALGSALDPKAARGLPPIGPLQTTSQTPQGPLRHLAPVVRLSGVDVRWRRGSVPLGHDEPVWLPRPEPGGETVVA
jgi:crotonobetainyl-CoA:carnitine CoA-transferase CaiB-like acyl-CoA transferase